jgi:hypothetical protein
MPGVNLNHDDAGQISDNATMIGGAAPFVSGRPGAMPSDGAPPVQEPMQPRDGAMSLENATLFAQSFWRLPNPGGILSTCFAHENPVMDYFLKHKWDALSIALNKYALEQPKKEGGVDAPGNVPTAMSPPASRVDSQEPSY